MKENLYQNVKPSKMHQSHYNYEYYIQLFAHIKNQNEDIYFRKPNLRK